MKLLLLLLSIYVISSVLGNSEAAKGEPSYSYNRPMTLNLRLRGGPSQLSPFERLNSNMNMIDLRPRLALPRSEYPSPIPSYLTRSTPNNVFADAAAAASANARGPSFVMPSGKSLFEDQLSSRQPPNIHHDPTTILMESQNSQESLSEGNPLKSLLNIIHQQLFGNNIDKPVLFRNQGNSIVPEFDSPAPFLVDRMKGIKLPVDDENDYDDHNDDDENYYDDGADDNDDDYYNDDDADGDDLIDDDFIKKLFHGQGDDDDR